MTLGYDVPRPTEKQYHHFLESTCRGLERIGNNNNLGLTIYGSFVRGDYIIGESDIDAVLVFPYNVKTDKRFFGEVARVFADAQAESGFPMEDAFQVCPLDVGIMKDGRFNSLTDEFESYFARERRVLFGEDYTIRMTCEHAKPGDVAAISHNLRKARQSLLFSEYTRKNDLPAFVKGFRATLKAASRGSKQILHIADGRLRFNRFSALGELQNVFPRLDTEPLKIMKRLYTNPSQLDAVYRNPDEALRYWNDFLTFFEETIAAYIRKFPNHS